MSLVRWLLGGDRNTTFYYYVLQVKRAQASMGFLDIDGVIMDVSLSERHVINYYARLFGDDVVNADTIDVSSDIPSLIDVDENARLVVVPD